MFFIGIAAAKGATPPAEPVDRMDRPIDSKHLQSRRLRRVVTFLAIAAGVVALVIWLPGWVRPTVDRDRVRTARVERGPMEETLSASGIVVPRDEHVLTSPAATRVKRILREAGDPIAAGEPILELESDVARLEVERLDQQIALRRNSIEQTRLTLEAEKAQLAGDAEIKELELESATYAAERDRRLFTKGLVTEDVARKSETDAERMRIQLRELKRQSESEEKLARAKLEALELELALLQSERAGAQHLVDRAVVASDRDGVLTWRIESEGLAVERGAELARIADLQSFRVDATVSDVQAPRLHVDQPVVLRSGDTRLEGRIDRILPTVENGTLQFEVALDEPSHPILRHNLRLDTHVITERHEATLRVKRGSFFQIDGRTHVFVVDGDRALRRPVTLGITNFEAYELLDGVNEGDEIVLSDLSDYRNTQEVRLR